MARERLAMDELTRACPIACTVEGSGRVVVVGSLQNTLICLVIDVDLDLISMFNHWGYQNRSSLTR